eukprot:XP_017953319.1 PREDICTED: UNC93-like protein MFSD11 [Xenopus tropicalis]
MHEKLLNIIILGIGFMFMFTAFQTSGNVAVSLHKVFIIRCQQVCQRITEHLAVHESGCIVHRSGLGFKISITKEMLLLSILVAYTGLELTFYSGVYGTCIGSMKVFEADAKSLIGLSGIFVGLGEVLGMFSQSYSKRRKKISCFPSCSKTITLACSFLLGLGDSCYNTQMLSILGSLYPDNSAPAFAVFKFVQSVSAAVAFFYSNYLLLHWQLLILVIFGFFGTISFFFVEWGLTRRSQYNSM